MALESKQTRLYCIDDIYFSYDGSVYHKHADSKHAHFFTSLAIIDGIPMATGGYGDYPHGDYTTLSETYDYKKDTWIEIKSVTAYENL